MNEEELQTLAATLDEPEEEGVMLIVKLDPETEAVLSVQELT